MVKTLRPTVAASGRTDWIDMAHPATRWAFSCEKGFAMRVMSWCVVLPFALWSGAALASPATPDGADALIALFQTYLGSTAGVVSVVPLGETYGVKLDFTPLVAKLPDVTASLSPLEFTLTDNGDGTWAMAQDQILQLDLKVPGQLDLSLHVGNIASDGVFDAALQTFTTNSASFSDLSLTETMVDPTLGDTRVTYQIARGQYESTGVAGGEGGVDLTTTYAMSGLSESFTLPAFAEGEAATEITLHAESYTAEGHMQGLRPEALTKLLAFFVANPSEAAVIAQQAGLKSILTEGLPLFDTIESIGTITAISADTPLGTITLDEMGVDVAANGLTENGMVSEGFRLKGLALPDGLVPDWAVGLVPTEASIGFTVADFNLAGPVAILLASVDLGAEIPPETQAVLLDALLPEGAVTFTLSPGGVTAPLYALSYEGVLSYAPEAMPQGSATFTATGIPAVLTALESAPPEVAMQIAPMLAMAQGLAEPGENDGLVWNIEMTPEGTVLINGTDLMGGGQ
jgi:hypothetical protein